MDRLRGGGDGRSDPRVHACAAQDHPVSREEYRLLGRGEPAGMTRRARSTSPVRRVPPGQAHRCGAGRGALRATHRALGPRGGPHGKGLPTVAVGACRVTAERHYDLAGGLLAQAVERATTEGVGVEAALHEAAFEAGRQIGAAARTQAGPRPGRRQLRGALASALQAHGYEPRLVDGEIVLANCPFHALAERHRTLVCGMNLDLLGGLVDGIGAGGRLAARLAPQAGQCCVRLDAA